jgi:hypothetical protein
LQEQDCTNTCVTHSSPDDGAQQAQVLPLRSTRLQSGQQSSMEWLAACSTILHTVPNSSPDDGAQQAQVLPFRSTRLHRTSEQQKSKKERLLQPRLAAPYCRLCR